MFHSRSAVRITISKRVRKRAVKGMLPKGRLGRQMYKKLHVYAGNVHPHTAQQPKLVDLGGNK